MWGGEFHFTSNKVRYFTISVRKLFHIRRAPNISLKSVRVQILIAKCKNIFFVAHTQKIQLVRVGFFHLCRQAQHRFVLARNIIWASAQHHCRSRHKWTRLRQAANDVGLRPTMLHLRRKWCCASRKRNRNRSLGLLIYSWFSTESMI